MLKFTVMLLALSTAALGTTTGIIAGTVTDPGGGPVVGAAVTIEGTPYGAMTSSRGEYVIAALPPGEYTLIARMIGRTTSRVEGVIVQSDNTSRIDFELPEDATGSSVIRVIGDRSRHVQPDRGVHTELLTPAWGQDKHQRHCGNHSL